MGRQSYSYSSFPLCIALPGSVRAIIGSMEALKHALIWILQVVFALGAVVCMFSVIPVTAYRLFQVLFENSDEHVTRVGNGAPH